MKNIVSKLKYEKNHIKLRVISHVAGAGVIPLRIAPEKMLVFSESLPYTSLEIGLKTIFHLWP